MSSSLLHLVPSGRGEMTTAAAESYGHVVAFCARNGIEHTMLRPENCFVEDSRNQAVQTAIKSGFDLLLMQDPDVAFGSQAFPQLWFRLKHEGPAAVGAVVRRRGRSVRLNAATAKPGCVHQHVEIGTALMLIDVKQLAEVDGPWFRRETNATGTRTIVGEDIAFCRKLKAAGLNVLADFTFSTEHRDEQWLSTNPLIRETREATGYELTRTPTVSGNDRLATSA